MIELYDTGNENENKNKNSYEKATRYNKTIKQEEENTAHIFLKERSYARALSITSGQSSTAAKSLISFSTGTMPARIVPNSTFQSTGVSSTFFIHYQQPCQQQQAVPGRGKKACSTHSRQSVSRHDGHSTNSNVVEWRGGGSRFACFREEGQL